MSKVTINTPLNITIDFSLASFGKRLLAWFIDVVVLLCYLKIVDTFAESFEKKIDVPDTANVHWFGLIIILPAALYHLIFEYMMQGQTIGKKITQIKVINETGGNATLSQYLLRWMLRVGDVYIVAIVWLISILGPLGLILIYFMGFFALLAIVDVCLVLFHNKSQRLGDITAGTIIIDTKTKDVLNETVFKEVEDDYIVKYHQVMKLSDRDMNTINGILANIAKTKDKSLAYNTANKIKQVLQISSSDDDITFIETILKDYNYLSTK